jgi:hypothetical protein
LSLAELKHWIGSRRGAVFVSRLAGLRRTPYIRFAISDRASEFSRPDGEIFRTENVVVTKMSIRAARTAFVVAPASE